jgi:hypothetical protein
LIYQSFNNVKKRTDLCGRQKKSLAAFVGKETHKLQAIKINRESPVLARCEKVITLVGGCFPNHHSITLIDPNKNLLPNHVTGPGGIFTHIDTCSEFNEPSRQATTQPWWRI